MISRRAKVIAFGGLALIFVIGFLVLRPVVAPLSDAEYVAIAKDTPQGRLYFTNHTAPCQVVRAWNVGVICDTVSAGGAKSEKFRIYIDPRTNNVVDADLSFDP